MPRRVFRHVALRTTCFLALVVGPVLSFGQVQPTVTGRVLDSTGGVLPGALVEAVATDRAVASAISDHQGRYELSVPAGAPFRLRVRLDGFAERVVALPGATATVSRDITLAVGRVSDTVVVTASRSDEDRARVTHAVSVATAADVQALGAASLADLVRFVPGVAIEGSGREGAVQSLFSRGGESDYNVVLIDGVRVNQNGGVFDLGRITAAEIERVEIVRGAQSALWGSDAMGSVVQVITRRAGASDAPYVAGSLAGGSFNTLRTDARLTGGAAGLVNYRIGASRRQTDGAFADILPEDDSFEQTTFDAGFRASLGSRASVGTGVRYSDAEGRSVGPITYGARDTGAIYDTRDIMWHANVSHALGSRFTGTLDVHYFDYESLSADTVGDAPFGTYAILEGTPNALFPDGMKLVRLITAAEFASLSASGANAGPNQFLASATSFDFPFSTPSELRRPAVRYQGDVTWAAGRFTAGYDWERETNPLIPGFSLDNHGVFAQQQFSVLDRWYLTIGARSDSKEGYDSYFSPKLSVGGFLVPARAGALSSLKVFGNVGRGIKSPIYPERFGASYADPNPNLEVERARTADVGVEATFADQHLRGSVIYFDNAYDDQIAYRFGPVGDGVPEFLNIDGSEASGVELEFALQRPVGGFTAAATWALVDTRVVTNLSTSQQFQPGQPLLRRPKHSGTLRAAYAAGRVTVAADARMIGDRHDNSFLFMRTVANATRPAFSTDITVNPGYTVMGLGVDVRAVEGATVFLRVNNLGDTEYDSALGYPGLPREVLAGVRIRFGGR
ncbi:MAG: hypothetical protein FJW23_08735 [Acidimicrobiia bacterium]|nr:hypothetical protein [Acidimicrobiia bacterium]